MMQSCRDKVMEAVDDGIVGAEYVLVACLKYMSDDQICEMLRMNELTYVLGHHHCDQEVDNG